jgi:uncharacterized protein
MTAALVESFSETSGEQPVRGFLHTASGPDFLVLAHGAGGNSRAPFLVALAEAFAATGINVLRCDLPFRQKRAQGPPSPGSAASDQAGLQRALDVLRQRFSGRAYLGGHSYGGRQASLLAAARPASFGADALLLLSYPLHPPGKAQQLRTAHWPQLQTPVLFVHGTKDPFGSIAELESALPAIPARKELLTIEGAGHDLLRSQDKAKLVAAITAAFRRLIAA